MKKPRKEKPKSRATIRDLTTESEAVFKPGRQGGLGNILQKKHGQLKIQWRNSKGHIAKPDKRSKIRYELVDSKTRKIIYKGDYKKFKRIPGPNSITRTAQNYFRKGKGTGFKSTTLKAHKEFLKAGKEIVTIDIEFQTP